MYTDFAEWFLIVSLVGSSVAMIVKRDVPLIIKILFPLLACTLLIQTPDIFNATKERSRALSKLNLDEYYAYSQKEQQRFSQMPFWQRLSAPLPPEPSSPFYAFAKVKTTIRQQPSSTSAIVGVLDKDTMVGLPSLRSRDGWYAVSVEQRLGWVRGVDLRASVPVDQGRIVTDVLKTALKFTFPEQSVPGKIVGIILAVPVSLLVGLCLRMVLGWDYSVRCPIVKTLTIDHIEFALPLFFSIAKNKYFMPTLLEGIPLFLFSMLASLPSSGIIYAIQVHRRKHAHLGLGKL